MNDCLPRISVLLPVYNGGKFLAAAIESVLSQSFTDFELLILNDGSKDDSATIAQSYSDDRIRYFEHPNMGLPATLNEGARHARGEFLFRQDQDDISYSDRFERQVKYLDAHPDVAVLGTWARIFVDGNPQAAYRFHRHPIGCASISLCTIFDSAFVHSSVAIRHKAFEEMGGYSCDPARQPPEDFELWSRVCRGYRVANLPEVLLDYREVAGSMSRALRPDFAERMIKVSTENLECWLKGSAYEIQSEKIAALYHMNGCLPSKLSDLHLISAVFGYLSKVQGPKEGKILGEYNSQLRRLKLNLWRNCCLGASRNRVTKFIFKAIFKVLGYC